MDYRAAHIHQIRAGQHRTIRLAAGAAFGVVATVAGLMLGHGPAWQGARDASAVDAAPVQAAVQGAVQAVAATPARQGGMRRVYPYSIVPGGVTDRAELMRAIRTDKVVAAHYAAFQADKAVALKVSKPRAVYVSYRKRGKVYWTARKVMLAEGETLLSDGNSEIRTRCGNRISDVAQWPVSVGEPSEQVLDTAMDAPDDGGAEPAGFALDDGGAGASPSTLTFAHGAGLVMTDNGMSGGGMGAPAGPARGFDSGSVLPATMITPPAQAIQAAAQRTQVTRANPGSRIGVAPADGASSPPTNDHGGVPGGSEPVPPSNGDPAPHTPPELPPLPGVLDPVPPAPLAPTQPGGTNGGVPEPGALWLSGIALAAMLALRRLGPRSR
jgi:hypothetical protein